MFLFIRENPAFLAWPVLGSVGYFCPISSVSLQAGFCKAPPATAFVNVHSWASLFIFCVFLTFWEISPSVDLKPTLYSFGRLALFCWELSPHLEPPCLHPQRDYFIYRSEWQASICIHAGLVAFCAPGGKGRCFIHLRITPTLLLPSLEKELNKCLWKEWRQINHKTYRESGW